MDYTIAAIPTRYANVNFRSRLEARWAAFFDLCGWGWDYEPFDLEGWIPDFIIKGKYPSLIEVKPILFSMMNSNERIVHALSAAEKANNVAQSFRKRKNLLFNDVIPSDVNPYGEHFPIFCEVIICGTSPYKSDCFSGWALGPMLNEGWCYAWPDEAVLWFGVDSRFEYSANVGWFAYRVSGEHDGDKHLKLIRGEEPEEAWKEAGNIVQWHK